MKIVTAICAVLITTLLAIYVIPRTEFFEHLQLRVAAHSIGLPAPKTRTDFARVRNYAAAAQRLKEAGPYALKPQTVREMWDHYTALVNNPVLDQAAMIESEREALELSVSLGMAGLHERSGKPQR